MSTYVVDASVAAKWFLEEEQTASARRLLDDRHQLHAPDFCLVEIDSILCKCLRRGDMNEAEARRIRAAVRRFPIQTHPAMCLLDPAFVMANRTGRSLYDCLYLALAALIDGQLVTADRRLYRGLARGPFSKHVVWVEDVAE